MQSFPDQEGKSDGTETTANLNQKLYFHRIGSDQSQDVLCAEWPDNPNWMGYILYCIVLTTVPR